MKSLKDSLSKFAALTVKISVFAYIKIVSLPLTITLFNLFFFPVYGGATANKKVMQ
jgi:hypothetical protein